MLGGFLAWLTVGGAFYALHDPSMIMSKYKRGRGREIIAETIGSRTAGLLPFFYGESGDSSVVSSVPRHQGKPVF